MMKGLRQPKVGAVASNFAFEADAVGQCTVSGYARVPARLNAALESRTGTRSIVDGVKQLRSSWENNYQRNPLNVAKG